MVKVLNQIWSLQIARFFLVGIVNTAFGYSIFAMFILLGLHYVLAVLLALVCGVMFNFKTTGTIVFKNKNNRLILSFIAVYILMYLLNIGFLRVCGLNKLLGEAIIIVPLALLTFWLQKQFVFREVAK
jgi:putative flippase GtrA